MTREQIKAALLATATVTEAIRELQSVPNGELYARVMGVLSLEAYERIIGTIKRADPLPRVRARFARLPLLSRRPGHCGDQ